MPRPVSAARRRTMQWERVVDSAREWRYARLALDAAESVDEADQARARVDLAEANLTAALEELDR